MTQTIYRYGLGRSNNVKVDMQIPQDAIVLHVEYDRNSSEFCLWVIVLTDVTKTDIRSFYISGTGMDLSKNLKGDETMGHIASFSVDASTMQGWFHAFEILYPEAG